jgi:GDP-fucose protein O-fucosyltransferase
MGGFNSDQLLRLMNSYLAYKTNRAYVFSEFVWKREYYPWPEEKALNWPPITPLLALISGPSAGDPWPANDPAPRSISDKWFEVVCPPERRKIINTREIKPHLWYAGGREVFETWKKALDGPEPCIEIQSATREQDNFSQVFDLWIWGSGKLIEIWDEFKASPVSQSLGASHIVQNALDDNKHVFEATPEEFGVVDPYSRMLAIHLRRGDFREACKMLSDNNATFYSWNLFEFLPDKFTPPSGGTIGKNTPENDAKYMERCLPSDDDILQKIRDSRRDYLLAAQREGRNETVDVLYILTNEDNEWLTEIKKNMKNEGWRVIITSRDLKLNMEAKEVSMAVDMEIARKASVFIGNGVSAKYSS